ncbi:DUF3592 domain-containing protein [Alcanivorax sediminis]|uniref:DUF3592 domain-containing protein n=1 Tax=Alcanivorax sediminis TaxID=2663008 RepID=A0A6N7M1Z0_9GAMM|nr:DUF3592 domain-containing protein [Alcanivorax sediminis]MQX54491.1 DUF3592 domain-containing protein [Alcanivorax sediminis]
MSVNESKQNKKGGIGGYLFGGIFLAAGLAVMLFVAVIPIAKYIDSGSWDRVPATVLSSNLHSHRSDGSTTYSVSGTYRYRYRGVDYTSSQVSQYSGSDNFGDYWQQLYGRIDTARRNNRTVSAWVNPDAPHEAYLDRTFRWGSVIFGFTFGGVFALVGGGVMLLMRRGSKDAALVSETGFYSSQEKSGHWFLVGFGAIFILLPSPAYLEIWKEVSRGDFAILLVLLFPLVGAGIAFAGWKMRQNYRFFGPTPLKMDPEPGQAGGQVGGQIHLGRPVPDDASLSVWLSCVRFYYSGSGKDRKTRESILWQTEQRAYCVPRQAGTDIQFCFDAPADQPATRERERSLSGRQDWIRWRVSLEGQLEGRELKRSWEIPVVAGSGASRYQLPESHSMADRRERELQAVESASEQIRVEQTGQGLYLESRPGRNLGMKLGMLLFGGIFAGVGTGLFIAAASEGVMLYFMGSIFGLIGYLIVFSSVYTLARGLQVWIRGSEIRVVRRWLGIPLYRREGRLLRAEQLVLKSGMSSTSNGRQTEYMTLQVEAEGKTLRLAEGIKGREVGEALREAVLRALRLV